MFTHIANSVTAVSMKMVDYAKIATFAKIVRHLMHIIANNVESVSIVKEEYASRVNYVYNVPLMKGYIVKTVKTIMLNVPTVAVCVMNVLWKKAYIALFAKNAIQATHAKREATTVKIVAKTKVGFATTVKDVQKA